MGCTQTSSAKDVDSYKSTTPVDVSAVQTVRKNTNMPEQQEPKVVHDLELVKAKLAELREELFTVANDFALGRNGLPKNGAVAVCMHKISNEAGNVLKALDDPDFAERLTQYHLHEHAIKVSLEIRGVIPRL